MTLTRRITRSAGPAEGSAIAFGRAARAAALAAWRRTEPSAQPVARKSMSSYEDHDRAVTQDACATNDPTCSSTMSIRSQTGIWMCKGHTAGHTERALVVWL